MPSLLIHFSVSAEPPKKKKVAAKRRTPKGPPTSTGIPPNNTRVSDRCVFSTWEGFMPLRKVSRKDLLAGCAETGPGDGRDPRYDRPEANRRK